AVLAVLGGVVVMLLAAIDSRGRFAPVYGVLDTWRLPAWPDQALRPRILTAAGLIILCMPVCVPLITDKVVEGHDAFEYVPRLVEFHENISHGILLPRWAPDLSHGTGQPLFLFNPPLIYYLAESWHLAGLDFVSSINAACIVLVLASAIGIFLLGRLYFGD